jgi:uncharacterized membrane protein
MFKTLEDYESYIKEKSIDELDDIASNIDQEKHPDRYSLVQSYLKNKKENLSARLSSNHKSVSFKHKWFFTLIVSIFFFYKGLYILFVSDEEKILGGFGGAFLQFIKTEYGSVTVSIVFFIIGCLLLYFSLKERKQSN